MSSAGSRSIKFRIVALVALIIAPLLVMFALVTLSLVRENRLAIESQRQNSAHQLSAAVDRDFVELKGELTGIAASIAARSLPNFEFEQQLARNARFNRIVRMWTFSPNGTTKEQFAEPLPDSHYHILTDDFVSRVFAGKFSASDVQGEGMGNATIVIGVPVFGEKNTVESGLAGEVSVVAFNQAFNDAAMSNSWIAGVVDQNGNFVARSLDAESKVGTAARPELAMAAHEGTKLGVFENITFEGTPVLNSFERSSLTQWTSCGSCPEVRACGAVSTCLDLYCFGRFSSTWLFNFCRLIDGGKNC